MPEVAGADEARAVPAKPGWVRRLWGYMMLHRRDLLLALAAAALSSVCQTIIPLIERQIVDGVIVTHTSSLWPWLVFLVGLALASFGFLYVRRYRGGRMALGVQFDLRNAMHEHLQVLDFDNLDRMPGPTPIRHWCRGSSASSPS
jgi:ATP-binding cassette subfamily B protein